MDKASGAEIEVSLDELPAAALWRLREFCDAVLAPAPATNPEQYRINDDVEFGLDLFESVDGELVPYRCVWVCVYVGFMVAAPLFCLQHTHPLPHTKQQKTKNSADDVQVSFVMLDPYVRQALRTDGAGHYSLQFKVPDVYGVFKYAIDYQRRGYSTVTLQHAVPVRPFRHDEYERFLLPAFPYYASAASTMAAFLLVGAALLYSRG